MGVTTSQQILRYYELYRDTEIMFSKEVLNVLQIDPRQIYIKCNGVQWACIINSSSLVSARIIVGTKGGAYAAIQKDNTSVSLRFFFADSHGKSMSFFVNTRVSNIEAYIPPNDLAIATLTFNSKPPDDLIEILGRLLEAKNNSMNRTEERISITADSKRRLGLLKEEALAFVQNVPRNCIVRNLSFSGANILMIGIPKFLQEKETILRLEFDEPHEFIDIKGIVAKVENIEGRKDLVALTMKFDEETIPISYKMHINACITTTVRKKVLMTTKTAVEHAQKKTDSENPAEQDQKTEDSGVETQASENKTNDPTKAPAEGALETQDPSAEASDETPQVDEKKAEPNAPSAQENPSPKPQGSQ